MINNERIEAEDAPSEGMHPAERGMVDHWIEDFKVFFLIGPGPDVSR